METRPLLPPPKAADKSVLDAHNTWETEEESAVWGKGQIWKTSFPTFLMLRETFVWLTILLMQPL